ncbi:unnamed protein product, partial [marine sediment metagenome]
MSQRTFIIAEIGINHNGDLDLAKQLIMVAKHAGCDAVKFQTRDLSIVYTEEELHAPRDTPYGTTNFDLKNQLEFYLDDYVQIDQFCKKNDIEWFSSAWDIRSLVMLKKFDCKYNKVASAMLGNKPLVTAIAKEQKYTFISTGMSTIDEIDHVVETFKYWQCPFELMHCNSTYPMPVGDANLLAIQKLKDRFKKKVGYSGHEAGIIVSCTAVALGASSIERHITLDRSMF